MSEQNAGTRDPESLRASVRKTYGAIATQGTAGGCCAPSSGGGCGPSAGETRDHASRLGYSEAEQQAAPEGADLGLGCGNPQAIAALQPGETVLDLGSGAGFDTFLAAPQVGPRGRVIGVDMTPEMIEKARANAAKVGSGNVEFRLGEIEHLPVESGTVDAIISNCVINLSPDKAAVFREAFRVLKPGGRLAVKDIVATAPLPEEVQADLNAYVGCVAGAEQVSVLEAQLREAGFAEVAITPSDGSREFIGRWVPGADIGDYVLSASIHAVKP